MEVVPTIAKVKGTSGKGLAAQISKGRSSHECVSHVSLTRR